MPERTRGLRILFFMLHPGYLRYFRSVVELLASRGHEVTIAVVHAEKDPGDRLLAESLPGIPVEPAPVRSREDRWRPLAALVRSALDISRYSHPRYREAPKLRARVRARTGHLIAHGSAGNRVTRSIAAAAVDAIARPRSARGTLRVQRLLQTVERAVPTSPEIDAYLQRRAPDLVLATPVVDFASPLVEYLKSAAAGSITNAVCVASWDNLTGKGLLRVVPDRVFVWNETQRDEAAELHGIPRDRVVATGAPKFDEWFARTPSWTHDEFASRVGLPAGRPYVLYLCSSPFIAPDEVAFVRDWIAALRGATSPEVRDTAVLVRPHPQNAAQWAGVELDDPDVAVWPRSGAQPDSGEARADFFDSLWHSQAVVGINTSAMIEAAIVGKSVLTVTDARFAGTQQGTLHFRYLEAENGGFLFEASSLGDHVDQLTAVLSDPDAAAERTLAFVDRFVRPRGHDRPASEVLADELERLAAAAPVPAQRDLASQALRLALTPFVQVAGRRDGGPPPLMDG